MTVAAYPEFFNDVFGPVMQPGSSSHFAGPCRLGLWPGNCSASRRPGSASCSTSAARSPGPSGSWPRTAPWSAASSASRPTTNVCSAPSSSPRRPAPKSRSSSRSLTESDHPNAVKFILTGRDGREAELVGNSTGGGMVETVAVNGFPLHTIGDTYALLVFDAQRQIGEEQLEALRARAARAGGEPARSPSTASACCAPTCWPCEPDLVALNGLLTADSARRQRRRPQAPPARDQPARSQAPALRHDDRLARDRRARGPAAVGGRRPVRDGRLGVAARLDHRPHAHARRPHAPADARRVRGGPRRPHEPVQARFRRPLGRARRLGTRA